MHEASKCRLPYQKCGSCSLWWQWHWNTYPWIGSHRIYDPDEIWSWILRWDNYGLSRILPIQFSLFHFNVSHNISLTTLDVPIVSTVRTFSLSLERDLILRIRFSSRCNVRSWCCRMACDRYISCNMIAAWNRCPSCTCDKAISPRVAGSMFLTAGESISQDDDKPINGDLAISISADCWGWEVVAIMARSVNCFSDHCEKL